MKREDVYKIIDKEREYQDYRWGGLQHDLGHSVGDFIIYMEHYLNKAKKAYSTAMNTDQPALEELRKVAALAVVTGEMFGFPERDVTQSILKIK